MSTAESSSSYVYIFLYHCSDFVRVYFYFYDCVSDCVGRMNLHCPIDKAAHRDDNTRLSGAQISCKFVIR